LKYRKITFWLPVDEAEFHPSEWVPPATSLALVVLIKAIKMQRTSKSQPYCLTQDYRDNTTITYTTPMMIAYPVI